MEKVISEREVFTLNMQGAIEFSHVQLLFRQGNQFFLGRRQQRKCSAMEQSELYNVVAISPDCYHPTLPPHTTLLHYTEGPIHIKRPNLNNYTSPSSISAPLLREIEVCEVLLNNPHPNVATYLGCKVLGDRLDGICFELYPQNLMSMLNPGSLNKKALLENRKCSLEVAEKYLDGIEAGIRHLHSLGYVHNDINPMNIMISGEGVPVIIDFDSCVKVGESLENVKKTYGWHDKNEKLARESNDLDALREIRTWLTGTSALEFQYPI